MTKNVSEFFGSGCNWILQKQTVFRISENPEITDDIFLCVCKRFTLSTIKEPIHAKMKIIAAFTQPHAVTNTVLLLLKRLFKGYLGHSQSK